MLSALCITGIVWFLKPLNLCRSWFFYFFYFFACSLVPISSLWAQLEASRLPWNFVTERNKQCLWFLSMAQCKEKQKKKPRLLVFHNLKWEGIVQLIVRRSQVHSDFFKLNEVSGRGTAKTGNIVIAEYNAIRFRLWQLLGHSWIKKWSKFMLTKFISCYKPKEGAMNINCTTDAGWPHLAVVPPLPGGVSRMSTGEIFNKYWYNEISSHCDFLKIIKVAMLGTYSKPTDICFSWGPE